MKNLNATQCKYENPSVNLMLIFLEQAYRDALKGKITDTCTNIRLACRFQDKLPRSIKLDKTLG